MKLSKREKEKLDEVELQKAEILLTAIEYACEALIACAQKIDALDISTPSNFERCGTRLANIASIIKSAIHEKHFADSSSCNIIFQLAMIFDQALPDPQAELYSIFFNVIGQVSLYFLNVLFKNKFYRFFMSWNVKLITVNF